MCRHTRMEASQCKHATRHCFHKCHPLSFRYSPTIWLLFVINSKTRAQYEPQNFHWVLIWIVIVKNYLVFFLCCWSWARRRQVSFFFFSFGQVSSRKTRTNFASRDIWCLELTSVQVLLSAAGILPNTHLQMREREREWCRCHTQRRERDERRTAGGEGEEECGGKINDGKETGKESWGRGWKLGRDWSDGMTWQTSFLSSCPPVLLLLPTFLLFLHLFHFPLIFLLHCRWFTCSWTALSSWSPNSLCVVSPHPCFIDGQLKSFFVPFRLPCSDCDCYIEKKKPKARGFLDTGILCSS